MTVPDIEDIVDVINDINTVANIGNTADDSNDQETVADNEYITDGSNDQEHLADIEVTTDGRNEKETVADTEDTTDGSNNQETVAGIKDTTDGSNYHKNLADIEDTIDGRNEKETVADIEDTTDGRNEKETVAGIEDTTDGSNNQETVDGIEETTDGSNYHKILADIKDPKDGSNCKYGTFSLQCHENITFHKKMEQFADMLKNASDYRMKKRLIYRRKTRKAPVKELFSLNKPDSFDTSGMSQEVIFGRQLYCSDRNILYPLHTDGGNDQETKTDIEDTTNDSNDQEKLADTEEALVKEILSFCKPDSFDTSIKFKELTDIKLQLQYQPEINHKYTINKQDYVDTSGKSIEEIKEMQLSHIEISNAIRKHDLDLFTVPKISAATRIDDRNRVLAFPGICAEPSYLTQSLQEDHEKYLMSKNIFDSHLETQMEAKELLNFFEEYLEYILEKHNQIIIKHFNNSQIYLITKTLRQLLNDSITYIRQKVLMDVTWLHQEICKTRYLKFNRIIKISSILYEGLTVLLSEIFTMNHAQQTLLSVMILCYLRRENQSNLTDENITPPKKGRPSLILNVISSNVFRNAMDGIRYGMYELAYTRFFPNNCRMFIDIPINRFGFLGRSEKKGM